MEAEVPCILIVGSPGVGKSALVRRLTPTSAPAQGGTGDTAASRLQAQDAMGHGAPRVYHWHLRTKYYTAEVGVVEATLPAAASAPQTASASAPVPPWLPPHCEALVMVFDSANHESFLALQACWSALSPFLPSSKLDVLLCVANCADKLQAHPAYDYFCKMDGGALLDLSSPLRSDTVEMGNITTANGDPQAHRGDGHADGVQGACGEGGDVVEERRRGCMEWCIEQGIEYVESCATNGAFDAAISLADGDHSALAQGVGRMRAALEAHMWTGMRVLHTSTTSPATPAMDGLSEEALVSELQFGVPSDSDWTSGAAGEEAVCSSEGSGAESEEEAEEDVAVYHEYINLQSEDELWWDESEHPASSGAASNAPTPATLPEAVGAHIGKQAPSAQDLPARSTATEGADATPTEGAAGSRGEMRSCSLGGVAATSDDHLALGNTRTTEATLSAEGSDALRDSDMESLEQLMGSIALIRSKGRSMSDSARREMAAKTALRLAALLGDDG